jgi:hypothetical protein
MEKETLENLKKIRDMLSFLTFALSAKTQRNLEFSDDEERGFRDILSQISEKLLEINRSYHQATPPGQLVREGISSPSS